MSFEIVNTTKGRTSGDLNRNGAAMAVHNVANAANKTLNITIYPDLAKKLRWIKGDRALLSIGTGDSLGMIKVERVQDGGLCMSHGGSNNNKKKISISKTFGKSDVWEIKDSFQGVNCEFEIEENGALIILTPTKLVMNKKVGK